MYDIRQFKPTLYLVVLMGIVGFAMSVHSPVLGVCAAAVIAFNAWLIKTGRFTPLSRILANICTFGAFVWAFYSVRTGTIPIIAIGTFLVILQLIKFYEQRGNRDYAQLLVLSLLLMVSAALNTASLLFGLLFIAYLFGSLFCCLLFHLKVEADYAKQLMLGQKASGNSATIRQDQHFLPRSMRRLTLLVATAAMVCAVGVFLLFPRGTGAGLLDPLQIHAGQPVTGFSKQLGYNQIARISQNNELVAYLEVRDGDEPLRQGPLYLRGLVYDRYSGAADDRGGPWQWHEATASQPITVTAVVGRQTPFGNQQPAGRQITQQWSLVRPLSAGVLFAMGGAQSIQADRDLKVRYWPNSQTLGLVDGEAEPQQYTVVSSGVLTQPRLPRRFLISDAGQSHSSQIATEIAEYARRPEVSGSNQDGALVQQRPVDAVTHPLDMAIAGAIENHLRTTFAYTLDLTDTQRQAGEDPLVGFLLKFKKGHCEYFAGAMTLMCQSLGMQARVVGGYKTDEYNEFEKRFVVRQTYAHAWVEVLGTDGVWVTFDPTSGNDPRFENPVTLWSRLKHLYDYFEQKWDSNVVAYDAQSRTNLLINADIQMSTAVTSTSQWYADLKSWLDEKLFWTVSSRLLGALLWGMTGCVLVAIGWFVYERWKLRRRAQRIGLAGLAGSDRLRMVRQLGFYDDLLRLLDRYQIVRQPHLTPLEFARSLSFLPSQAYDDVRRLTRIYYRIRYGQASLQMAQRRRLQSVLLQIAAMLNPAQMNRGRQRRT